MKRLIVLSSLMFLLVSFSAEAGKRHNVGSYFYTNLSPYGTWIEIDYGVVVWRPTIMHMGWAPYRMGRWIWTYDGWYWDSYESFGYITYHYGRWYYDDYYGWLWYPDYEWAPAWVEWRYDDDYIGWAPLHPYASFSISIGIFFTTTYYTPYHHWHFVGYRNFCDPYVYNYYVGPEYKYRIHSRTKYRTNYSYYEGRVQNRGIDVKFVKTRSGQDIKEREIIRVRNSKELDRNSFNNRNEIRTLDLSKDQLTRTENNNLNIQRDRRKTNIDNSKVQIGDRNKISTTSRNNETVEKFSKKNETSDLRKDNTRKVEDRKVDIKKNDNNDRNVPLEKFGKVNTDDQNRDRNKENNVNRTNQVNEKQKNDVIRKQETITQNNKVDRNQNTVKQNTQTQRTEVKKNDGNQNIKREVNSKMEVTRKNDQQKNNDRDRNVEENKKDKDSTQKSRR